MSLGDIIKGYVNSEKAKMGSLSESKQNRAQARLEICKSCPILDKATMTCDKSKGGCGCKMLRKVYCMTCKCPKGKW
jgi:hypothetical protein